MSSLVSKTFVLASAVLHVDAIRTASLDFDFEGPNPVGAAGPIETLGGQDRNKLQPLEPLDGTPGVQANNIGGVGEFDVTSTKRKLGVQDVEFSFMTDDLRYQARGDHAWGWIKRQIFGGRRIVSTLKDEIVSGHVCNKHGSRDQTYYASSLCYWIPQIKAAPEESIQGSQGPGLKWIKQEPGQQLCKKFSGDGECVKCAVCHNNGRTETGDVNATAFQENAKIALPVDCLKERAIETLATKNFDGNYSGLVTKKQECESKENEYNSAQNSLNANLAQQSALTSRIAAIPGEKQAAQQREASLRSQLPGREGAVRNARSYSSSNCYPFRNYGWYRQLTDYNTPAQTVLNSWRMSCRRPRRPYCNAFEDPTCGFRMANYERERREHEDCTRCEGTRNGLQSAVEYVTRMQQEIQQLDQRQRQLDQEKNQKEQQLRSAQNLEPGLRQSLQERSDIWLPVETECRAIYAEYTEKHRAWMLEDVPKFYSRSCERACLESSLKDAGCGVMEGVLPGDIYRVGFSDLNPGLRAICAPPFASFVRTPVKYGATAESETDMCGRIFSNAGQRPRRTQRIVLNSTLVKRERLWRRWRARWFVFENGNQVRSAQMRYWHGHPSEPTAIERGVKAIIVWDARSVEPVAGNYRWKDGSECFRLVHFYRTFHLCVPGSYQNAADIRDSWVEWIKQSIKFPTNYGNVLEKSILA